MSSAARRMNQKPIPGGPEMGERLRLSAQRHHPSREGIAGGANGEVSWLRAFRLAFPVSQWREPNLLPVTVAEPRRTCTGFRKSRVRVL